MESRYIVDRARDDQPPQTPVTAESLMSLRRVVDQNMSLLDDHSQQSLRKFANAAEWALTARDPLFQENFNLFKQNNESHTRESRKSNMVGKAKFMRYEDIQEAQKKGDEKEAMGKGRRGRKRRTSAQNPGSRKKLRVEEMEEAQLEIQALGLVGYCSVF